MGTGSAPAQHVPIPKGMAVIFLVALFLSAIGDEIAAIAVVFQFAQSGRSDLVAALLILQLAPAVLLAPLAGQLLDRRDAGKVLAAVSGAQSALVLVMCIWPSIEVLLVASTLVGVCAAIAAPAAILLIPVVTGAAFPTRANSLLELSRSASTLAGPVIGGVLVGVFGTQMALLVNAISFAVAGVVIVAVRVRRPVLQDGQVWWRGASQGLRLLAQQHDLPVTFAVLAVAISASSTVNVALVFFVRNHLDSGATTFGVLIAAWGLGALCGALLGARQEWHRPERVALLSAGAMGVCLMAYGLAQVVWVAILPAIGAGVANAFQNIAMRTTVQRRAPEEILGRAHAAAGSVVNSFFLVGFIVGGVLAAEYAQETIVVAGAVTSFVSLLGFILLSSRSETQ